MKAIWKLSDLEFKMNMQNMLRSLMEKVYNMEEQMDTEAEKWKA